MWVFGRFILKTAWSDWLVSLKYNASFKYWKFCSSGSNHPYPSLAKEGSLLLLMRKYKFYSYCPYKV